MSFRMKSRCSYLSAHNLDQKRSSEDIAGPELRAVTSTELMSELGGEETQEQRLKSEAEQKEQEKELQATLEIRPGPTYTVDDVNTASGFGKFQMVLTFVASIAWFADGFEVLAIYFLNDTLACDWEIYRWQTILIDSSIFLGRIVGAPGFGIISDTFGRKKALAVSYASMFLFGMGTAFASSVTVFIILRSLLGLALGGMGQVLVLCIEHYPPRYREIAGFLLSYSWPVGTMVLLMCVWLVMSYLKNWRYLLIIVSLPSLFNACIIKWYPESARYYLVSNQYGRAAKQLEQLVTMNKKAMPRGRLQEVRRPEVRGRLLDMFGRKHVLSTCLFAYIWFACGFSYYGLLFLSFDIVKSGKLRVSLVKTPADFGSSRSKNSTQTAQTLFDKMACKDYSNEFLMDIFWINAAELPSLLVFTCLVKLSRRKILLTCSNTLVCIFICFGLIDTENYTLLNGVFILSRSLLASTFQMIFVMTAEVYPTTLRGTGVGVGSAFEKMGAAVVPFVVQMLVTISPPACISVLAGASLLSAVASACLPHETKGVDLKDLTSEYDHWYTKFKKKNTDEKEKQQNSGS